MFKGVLEIKLIQQENYLKFYQIIRDNFETYTRYNGKFVEVTIILPINFNLTLESIVTKYSGV